MHHQLPKGIVVGLDFVEGIQRPTSRLHIRLLKVGALIARIILPNAVQFVE